jgi:hypothetical protein
MMALRRPDVEQTIKGRDARRGHVSEITEGNYGFGFQIPPRYGLELVLTKSANLDVPR